LPGNSITVITGEQGEGKTTLLRKIIRELSFKDFKAGGILSLGIWKNNKRDDIIARNLSSEEEILFCQREYKENWIKSGFFYINPDSLVFSIKAVEEKNCDYFVLDEVGRFEMEEKGWHRAFITLINCSAKPVIIVIRKAFLNEVLTKFSIQPDKIIFAEKNKDKTVSDILPDSFFRLIQRQNNE
jgi:nucleoside-triphosphatase